MMTVTQQGPQGERSTRITPYSDQSKLQNESWCPFSYDSQFVTCICNIMMASSLHGLQSLSLNRLYIARCKKSIQGQTCTNSLCQSYIKLPNNRLIKYSRALARIENIILEWYPINCDLKTYLHHFPVLTTKVMTLEVNAMFHISRGLQCQGSLRTNHGTYYHQLVKQFEVFAFCQVWIWVRLSPHYHDEHRAWL